ncbi:MAG: hypothetical protein KKH73_04575 [Actinobacteria bacterium]|nr:hypothetical protein [Actinomycetota bacterium]
MVPVVLLAALVSVSILGSGCGPSDPQQVVRKFLTAIEENNWYGYLASILPEQVRAVTSEEMNLRREAFKEHQEEFEDVKLEVKPDKEDKDVATVIIVGGAVSRMNPQTGEMETRSMEEFPEEQRTMMTRKYKGRWYVDIALAAPPEQPEEVEKVETEEIEVEERPE